MKVGAENRTKLVVAAVLGALALVFVVTRFAHTGIFVTSNNIQQRSLVWFAGVLVLLAMWIYFALKLLLLI